MSKVRKWGPLGVFAVTQFLMLLDTSVMNVAISQLVEDFDTDVTQIQFAITFYALVMAAFMLLGAKLSDVWGRRRAMVIGMIVYGIGSAITAASWSVPVLTIGWSVLEGLGAALVLPAMWALVPAIYKGSDRATAFGLIGGVAGAAVAVGPILGGWFTTELSWRWVFVGEVILAIAIVIGLLVLVSEQRPDRPPRIDWVGAGLSALGLGLLVFGALQSSQWGIITPRNSPIEPLGLSLTPFVVAVGIMLLYVFVDWERRVTSEGRTPLLRLELFKIIPFRSGQVMLVMQTLILAGAFFALPLYLQVVIGLDALETGIRLLPVSITVFLVSVLGSQFLLRFSPRSVVRWGLIVVLAAVVVLLGTIQPQLDGFDFGLSMALFGIGIGMLSAVLGNLIMSAVGPGDRNDASGLTNAAGQLGNALGVALIGAVVISTLASGFVSQVASDERIGPGVAEAVEVELADDISFVPPEEIRTGAKDAGADPELVDQIVDNYEEAQLDALRFAMVATAFIVLFALILARNFPTKRIDEIAEEQDAAQAASSAPED